MTDSLVSHYLRIETYNPNVKHGKGTGISSYYSIPNGNIKHIKEIMSALGTDPGVKAVIKYEKN